MYQFTILSLSPDIQGNKLSAMLRSGSALLGVTDLPFDQPGTATENEIRVAAIQAIQEFFRQAAASPLG